MSLPKEILGNIRDKVTLWLLLRAMLICFGLAAASFAVKAKELEFIGGTSVWYWSDDNFIKFFGFFYQLSASAVYAPIQIRTCSDFIFVPPSSRIDKEIRSTIIAKRRFFFNVLQRTLVKFYGVGGFFYFVTMNQEDYYAMARKNSHQTRNNDGVQQQVTVEPSFETTT